MAGGPSEDNPVGINVTAMVDIIFCILLFFMCSMKFKALEGKLDSWLPLNKGGRPAANLNQEKPEIRVVLSYDETRGIVERYFGRNPIPPEQGDLKLESLIDQQNKAYESQGFRDDTAVPVIIDAGPKVPWENVVNVLNLCKGLGVKKVEFGFGSEVKK